MALPFIAFWVLLAIGRKDLGRKKIFSFVAIWLALLIGFVSFSISPHFFVGPLVILDVILILMIFGGDIRVR
jgi:hypothetical protein